MLAFPNADFAPRSEEFGGSGLALAEKCGRLVRPSKSHRSDSGLAAREHARGLAVFARIHFRAHFLPRPRLVDQLHLVADDVNKVDVSGSAPTELCECTATQIACM